MDIVMPEVTFMATFDCTLKCRLCGIGVPYMHSEKRAFELEEIQKSMDRYFEIVPRVKMVTISGGEPLLFHHLAEMIRYLKKYEAQADGIRLVTNGTIIPTQQVLDAMKELGEKFYIIADNYGAENSKQISELDRILNESQIRHVVRNYTAEDTYCGGWVDLGGLAERKHTEAEAKRLYKACVSGCYLVSYGKMWPCAVSHRRYQIGLENDTSDYIDLLDTSLTIQDQRNKLQAIAQKKRLTACAYCNGFCADSERFIPAEQLTPEEVQYVRSGARSYDEVKKMMADKPVGQTT